MDCEEIKFSSRLQRVVCFILLSNIFDALVVYRRLRRGSWLSPLEPYGTFAAAALIACLTRSTQRIRLVTSCSSFGFAEEYPYCEVSFDRCMKTPS